MSRFMNSLMSGGSRRIGPADASCLLLLAGALVFPFSVAGANAMFGMALALGLLSGELAAGLALFFSRFRPLALLMSGYVLWALLALSWSPDASRGLSEIGHWWFFLLPSLLLGLRARMRCWLIWAISAGLALHLGYTLLQAAGLVEVTVLGSSRDNPTGHIGHIGFGVVYGMWAAWLTHRAFQASGSRRLAYGLFALWSVVAVFMAQGRSGYLVASILLLMVAWRHRRDLSLVAGKGLLLGVSCMLLALTLAGPGKARLAETWQHLLHPTTQEAKMRDARLSIWKTSLAAWQQHALFGVGTGGYLIAARQVVERHPDWAYGSMRQVFDHPHNLFLLALVEWGPVGLLVTLGLLFSWVFLGWRMDWSQGSAGCWIACSGLAMAVHGLSSLSLNEHFTGVLAILLLGLGLREAVNSTGHSG